MDVISLATTMKMSTSVKTSAECFHLGQVAVWAIVENDTEEMVTPKSVSHPSLHSAKPTICHPTVASQTQVPNTLYDWTLLHAVMVPQLFFQDAGIQLQATHSLLNRLQGVFAEDNPALHYSLPRLNSLLTIALLECDAALKLQT